MFEFLRDKKSFPKRYFAIVFYGIWFCFLCHHVILFVCILYNISGRTIKSGTAADIVILIVLCA